jgi:hypothetical protein
MIGPLVDVVMGFDRQNSRVFGMTLNAAGGGCRRMLLGPALELAKTCQKAVAEENQSRDWKTQPFAGA